MAEEHSNDDGTEDSTEDQHSSGTRRRKVLTAKGAIHKALEHLGEITGRTAESVTSVQRGEDYGWIVSLELVESHRIPDSSDILAEYKVELDSSGELISYGRQNRYSRGRPKESS